MSDYPEVTRADMRDEEDLDAYRDLLDAARRFIVADEKIKGDPHPDPGDVIASLAARHDMQLLVGAPCGCDEGDCPGIIGASP